LINKVAIGRLTANKTHSLTTRRTALKMAKRNKLRTESDFLK
jgi:hypothetical protein